MATVFALNEPVVPHAELFAALSAMQTAIAKSVPEAESVTLTFTPAHTIKVTIVVGGLPTVGVENQQKIMFKIENDMVPNYRLTKAVKGFENGNSGRRTVTAIVG